MLLIFYYCCRSGSRSSCKPRVHEPRSQRVSKKCIIKLSERIQQAWLPQGMGTHPYIYIYVCVSRGVGSRFCVIYRLPQGVGTPINVVCISQGVGSGFCDIYIQQAFFGKAWMRAHPPLSENKAFVTYIRVVIVWHDSRKPCNVRLESGGRGAPPCATSTKLRFLGKPILVA